MRNEREAYTTIPLGIILVKDILITVCAEDTPVLDAFIESKVKEFSTKKRMRFMYQILYRNCMTYQYYLRVMDRRRNLIEQRIQDETEDADLIDLHELEQMGFEIEASHHEVAPAQHEIDFKYGEALKTADSIETFKLVVKTIAKKHGLCATFMPKPKYGVCGSGMHMNMSLSKDGKNIFADDNDKLGLSQEAYYFIAGIMEHMREMTAITNPLVNSYKRLVPGYEAPIYIAWSAKNRSPLVRIPSARGAGTRVELRCPDPTANPYLAMAVCLKAGLDGIKRQLPLAPSVDSNIFELTREEKKARHIESLPANLREAVLCMRDSDFMKEALGEHIFTRYTSAKLDEWNEYTRQVTDWEISNYLYKV